MMKEYNCPRCNTPFEKELIVDFFYCKKCDIAYRFEKSMQRYQENENLYDFKWMQSQTNIKFNKLRYHYISHEIQKIRNIYSILDYGCGPGNLTEILSKNGYNVIGIDTSRSVIEYNQQYKKGNYYLLSENWNPNIKLDLIMVNQLIEHIREPDEIIQKFHSWLSPNGYIFIETPNLNSWDEKSCWRSRIGGMYYGLDHRIIYSPRSLRKLLENNGFEIKKIGTKTISPTIIKEIINLNNTKIAPLIRYIITRQEYQDTKKKYDSVHLSAKSNKIHHSKLKRIYDLFLNSWLVDLLLFVPNKISEYNQKGNLLFIIAQKKTQ